MKYFIAIVILLALVPAAIAQIQLPSIPPISFTVQAMVLSSVDDYTGTRQFLGLLGDPSYMTVKWNANYFDGVPRDVIVKCYLNCPNPGADIDVGCAGLQNCGYDRILSGSRSCVIQNPAYKINIKGANNVTCKFLDPESPDIPFKTKDGTYPLRIFNPVNYSIAVSKVTVTLGDRFNLPINVINFGLLQDVYSYKVAELETNFLSIERNSGDTEKVLYGEAGIILPSVSYLLANPTNVEILIKSNANPTSCSINSDCNYLGNGKCMEDGKCWKSAEIRLDAGTKSLSEFDIYGFVQIMLLSIVVLFLIRRNSGSAQNRTGVSAL